MRLKTAIWVSAHLRRLSSAGVFAAVARRGAEEAGAVFVRVNRLDGTADLYGPAPQTSFDETRPQDRRWVRLPVSGESEAAVADRLAREINFDPDLWIIEIDSRAGEHLLDVTAD